MRSLLVVMACLATVAAMAGEGYYPPRGNPYYESEVRHGPRFGFHESNPFGPTALRTRALSRGTLADALENEIARIEMLFYQGTPEASGRYSEITARFGPQWSPYFQSQIRAAPDRAGKAPAPESPAAEELVVESTAKALRKHQALVAEQLLSLYELRVARRLADQGLTPEMVGTPLAPNQEWLAARMAADTVPTAAGSVVKVATFSNPVGYLLPNNGGPQLLDVRTFTPDSSQNIVLLVSIRATLQKMDNPATTASIGLEMDLPEEEVGMSETVGGPAIRLLQNDPATVRRGGSSLCTADEEESYGALHDQPRYTLRIVTPEGATGGNVKISQVIVKVYYLTGEFVEAGTIR